MRLDLKLEEIATTKVDNNQRRVYSLEKQTQRITFQTLVGKLFIHMGVKGLTWIVPMPSRTIRQDYLKMETMRCRKTLSI